MIVFVATKLEYRDYGDKLTVLGAFHTRNQAIDACREDSGERGPDDCEDWGQVVGSTQFTVTRHRVPKLETRS